ncbi:PREDICTED: cell division cycle-associated protein 7-like [Ipomoea nil]|uniref:cell division cycle-associated protein 7-like n=1 Tax=Ipomoea nil TaxID=35883 RepID=UPI0009018945|nr:PREDICTED: cell division cycle-associated protein 7-like [Ipomoea nil]XP_019176325.1 PREDICTED: cell division cycle-associated protein 7-like [Ipomoea nil]XP_019176326.1 PREDICTED: cell division cycle-associated protein 7-like [Ipomoea nil]
MVGEEDNGEFHTQKQKKGSEYEQSREERIKENLERMRKLGIFDLSLKFKSIKPIKAIKTCKPPQRLSVSPLPPSQPTRRSSRLQNASPVSYSELPLGKRSNVEGEDLVKDFGGSKAEIYTEEHEKLLGSTDMSWDLFVDGCGTDGKRIYDPVKGKTCHQCRQKTMGLRTHCWKCNKVQGQFCGDCLFMRYGEHVVEANQNPDWICPVCRGICNCSLCRQAKGWAPTGALYKKITALGYKSVAHYLIQTRQATTDHPENNSPNDGLPEKRSLPSSEARNETQAEEKRMDFVSTDDNEVARGAGKETECSVPQVLLKVCSENDETNPKVDEGSRIVVKVEHDCENAVLGSIMPPETSLKSKRKRQGVEPIPDSIAGRLRERRARNN